VTARVLAAAVSRHAVVSGWDVARQQPKAAERAVPAGSVYWLEVEDAGKGRLEALLEAGLWPDSVETAASDEQVPWRQRRAEGFNAVWLGAWPAGRK
jgi:CRISPR-associated protein Cmr3